MSDEIEQTTFDFTCNDGTVFRLPSNHPDITAGGIGGVGYSAIIEDSSLMPAEFEQFCTFRPSEPPAIEPEPYRPRLGKSAMALINERLSKLIPGWKVK